MRTDRGLTVVELLVAMVIAAVMMTLAIPAFNDFTSQRRMTSTVNSVVAAVNYARNEAARQATAVSVQAIDASDRDNEWGEGFCVTLGNPGDCNVAMQMFAGTDDAISLNGTDGFDGGDSWTFNSRGVLTNVAVGSVEICGEDADDDPGRLLRINATGRVSVNNMGCFP